MGASIATPVWLFQSGRHRRSTFPGKVAKPAIFRLVGHDAPLRHPPFVGMAPLAARLSVWALPEWIATLGNAACVRRHHNDIVPPNARKAPPPMTGKGPWSGGADMEDQLHQARVTMLGIARILDAMAEGEQEMDDALRDALVVLARALEAGAPGDAGR